MRARVRRGRTLASFADVWREALFAKDMRTKELRTKELRTKELHTKEIHTRVA